MDTIYLDICEAGKRFFWCVTENSDAYPLAHGHCDTFEEAEEQMWALGTMLARGRQIDDCTRYTRMARTHNPVARGCWTARSAKRAVWLREHTRPTGEVLYSEFVSDCGECEMATETHEIVKRTKTKVYVRTERRRVVALDRHRLESLGEASSRKGGATYYTQPYEIRCADEIAERKRQKEECQAELQMKRNAVTDDDLVKVRQIFDERMTGDLAVEMAYMMKKCGSL